MMAVVALVAAGGGGRGAAAKHAYRSFAIMPDM